MKVRMSTPLNHTSTMASIGASKPALHIARNPLPPFKRSTCSRMLSHALADGVTRMHVRFGARHLERINSERQDASAPQTYGYISELFSSPRHARVDPGVRCAQLITILVHYLALHDDGQLPPARSSTAAWARLPPPPYCDADARPRTLPEVHVEQAASSCVGTPVASRRHPGVTPAVKLVPAVHEPMNGTHGTSVPRRQFYDEAVEFVTQLLRQHQPDARGSRLRAEMLFVGSAAGALMSRQHAQLAIDDDYDAWAALARRVLTSKYLHLELGVFRCL
jgi:hypothetical protein